VSASCPEAVNAAAAPALDAPARDAALRQPGASAEMRRFSAGIRAIVALLCTLLLVPGEKPLSTLAIIVLLGYDLWSGYVLWAEASARRLPPALLRYWIDATWTVLMLQLTSSGTGMLVLTFVQPVVLASIGHGVRHGVTLALYAALGLIVDVDHAQHAQLQWSTLHAVPAAGVLALIPVAAVLSRPMSVLRQRLMLVSGIEAQLDPRRGLDAIASTLVGGLRGVTRADLTALVLPSSTGAPAVIGTAEDGEFRAGAPTHAGLEALLATLPPCALMHSRRRWRGLRGGTRVHGDCPLPAGAGAALDELTALLEVNTLAIVPLLRYDRRHGHIVLGFRELRPRAQELAALAEGAPELFRVIEQAALVDKLQEESAAHERVRIGRDLHDSAIQPYLGLKYAVEGVAQRVPRNDPARADIDALLELVNSEIGALREIISGLRAGEPRGDNALMPAVRRQVRRFSLLFGVDVQLDGPDELRTSRALAGALFHMVNEALNNVRKHTPARRVWIRLEHADDEIRMTVRDDAGEVLGRPVRAFHPRSLSERAAALGGSLTVNSPDGLHTEVVIAVPFEVSTRY